MQESNSFVEVGEIVKAVGLKGELKLYPLINWYEPLIESEFLVWDDGQDFTVQKWRFSGSCYVVKTTRAFDRQGAENMIGKKVGFLRSKYLGEKFPKPTFGLPFRFLGRDVESTDGKLIGVVSEVRLYGNQFTLVLEINGKQVMIPAVEPILKLDNSVDGQLIVDLPEGLLDVAGD